MCDRICKKNRLSAKLNVRAREFVITGKETVSVLQIPEV